MTDTNSNSCANCRLHRAEMRPKVISEAFDSIVEFADEDEKIYFCTVKNKEIGRVPVLCESFEAAPSVTAQLDEWEARFLARQSGREGREDR